MSQSFDSTYASLNPAQKEAVDTIEGPVMVIAGPGTGKTHVLAARIANILQKTDTPPYAILALTYTESAAVNMRERIVKMIGRQGYYVQISTFHAFCSDIISSHPEYFPIDHTSEPLSELEKYDIFEKLLPQTNAELLSPLNNRFLYIPTIINAISNLKNEAISPEMFASIVKENFSEDLKPEKMTKAALIKWDKDKQKNSELSVLYSEYHKELQKRHRFDFEDMIALVADAFQKNEMLLRENQEQLHYFLVDEYQDTNASQNQIVDLLASYWGDKANVFVVGDPNQSIFRFQGASIENTLNFVKNYPEAKIVTLQQGYRSTQTIYTAAHSLIENNTLTSDDSGDALMKAVSQQLDSNTKDTFPIEVSSLPSQTLELVYVAEEITSLIRSGTLPEEIAVLYKKNADAIELQNVLEKWGITYEVSGGENILEAEKIRQLLQLFYVIHDVRMGLEDERLFEIMSYEWTQIDKSLSYKIGRAAGKARISIVDLMQKGYDAFIKYHGTDEVTHMDFQNAHIFLDDIQRWSTLDAQKIFTEWFEIVIKESGYLDWILSAEGKAEHLTNLNSLFREVKALIADKRGLKLADFLRSVDLMSEHHIKINAEDLNVESGAVHLSTVHKAKGREWTYVYLVHCIDKTWGNSQRRELLALPEGLLKNTDLSKKERNEDDRRLFYVAMTRAKKKFALTYPKTIISNNQSREVVQSMFIDEIPSELRIDGDTTRVTQESQKHLEKLLTIPEVPIIKVDDKAFFSRLIQGMHLSVTALNTYLRNPEDFMQNSLLRVPRAKVAHMSFGTAVHKALEHNYREKLSQEKVLDIFETTLRNELVLETEIDRLVDKGRSAIMAYLKHHEDANPDVFMIERFFGKGFSKTVLDDIHLTGRIDRIDWIDREKKLVRVVDYKTGKPRTPGEIEGSVKDQYMSERELSLPDAIKGPYKRQLLFYKLLTELDQTFPHKVKEGVFSFVEPQKSNGKIIDRSFDLREEDVEELKKLIRQVMKEIRNLEFLNS